MSPAQEGAFFRLLCHAWNDPECCLPDDDNTLAVLSRLGKDWKKSAKIIRARFERDAKRPGHIFNQKQRAVRQAQRARIDAARDHARVAAAGRWKKPAMKPAMPEHNPSTTQAMPETMPKNASVLSTHLPSPITHKEVRGRFAPPTFDEVKLQSAKIGLSEIEAEKFFNHYQSNGWRVGRNPMRSWPHALTNWKINGANYANSHSQANSTNRKPNPRNAGIPTDTTEQGRKIQERIARNQTPMSNPVAKEMAQPGLLPP